MSTTPQKPDALRPAHPLSFFDPEQIDRPVPARPWRAMAIAAALATAVLTAGWELYWRAHWHVPGDFSNTSSLWAEQRRKAKGGATVMIGSSRILFDIDLDIWEELSGVRPVQLALEGTSPRIFLKDLADDEDFNGLVIVGVTAPLFFTRDGGRREEVLKDYRQETLSERADHLLSVQLEKVFAFLDEQTRPKRMLYLTQFPLRPGMERREDPHKLSIFGRDRNTEMWARVEEDDAYREQARNIWVYLIRVLSPKPGPNGEPPPPMPDAAIDAVIADVKASIDKIRARGGDVAFVRPPYQGVWQAAEDNGFPRARFWDPMIARTDTVGIAWQDYPELTGYTLPEWSHLSASEAERYTRAIVPIFYRELEARQAASK